ncbi:MAG: tetratricopeptide repeat protein [Thermodesulfovibrionia bacterium]
MRNIISYLMIFLTVFVFLLCLPGNSYAQESAYTIQIGSFLELEPAEKQFDLLKQGLKEENIDYLRVEKIGKYYSVRLGKFKDNAEAKKALPVVKRHVAAAITMKSYFIEKRMIKLYRPPGLAEDPSVKEAVKEVKPGVEKKEPEPEKAESRVTEKVSQKPVEKRKLEPIEKQIEKISGLVNKGDYKKALEIIEKEIKVRQESPELYGWYGVVLLKMDNPARAITNFQKAAELSPNVSDYHNGGGYSLFYLSRFNEAIDEFNKALSLNPANIDAISGLGITYVKVGNKDQAMDAYNKLKDRDKETADKLLEIIKRASL